MENDFKWFLYKSVMNIYVIEAFKRFLICILPFYESAFSTSVLYKLKATEKKVMLWIKHDSVKYKS